MTKRRRFETPDQIRARAWRSAATQVKLRAVLLEIAGDLGWDEQQRARLADDQLLRIAGKEWCRFAVEAAMKARLPKVWAGATRKEREKGALSSLEVLFNTRQPFLDDHGRRKGALGNLGWVLDCWDAGLEAWANRQTRLPV